MGKRKYICPRMSKVNIKADCFILADSVTSKYRSTGLEQDGGISGDGEEGDASDAF